MQVWNRMVRWPGAGRPGRETLREERRGGEAFVRGIEAQTQNRVELRKEERGGQWILREADFAYG